MSFTIIIPARYQSQRLPGKPLLQLAGKSMVQHVYERAAGSDARQVIVATDDERIYESVENFGGKCCMTSIDHVSGTDRLQEVTTHLGLPKDEIIVNVQGDEPLIPPQAINQVAANLAAEDAEMATLCEPITQAGDLFDPNVVKVTMNAKGIALYFSRAPIPYNRDSFNPIPAKLPLNYSCFRHLGLYAYRVSILDEFVQWQQCPLELAEKLEQLRVLWNGRNIHVDLACVTIPPGIDTPADLERVRDYLS